MTELTGKDIEFFGKITASMTHEFKNVLAIIKESAGLMEDITKIAPLSDSKHQEKFDNALKTIKNQLNRGMELSTVFNRFAHAPDKATAEINLRNLTEQVILLSDRFARLKHIELKAAPDDQSDKSISITGNPVWSQMAVCTGIECYLCLLPPDSEIILTSTAEDGKKGIRIECKNVSTDVPELCQALENSDTWKDLKEIMTAINGNVKHLENKPGLMLFFE